MTAACSVYNAVSFNRLFIIHEIDAFNDNFFISARVLHCSATSPVYFDSQHVFSISSNRENVRQEGPRPTTFILEHLHFILSHQWLFFSDLLFSYVYYQFVS